MYQDIDGEARIRYLRTLLLYGLSGLPISAASRCLENEPTQWPTRECPETYNYSVNMLGMYTQEAMRNCKSFEGHNQFKSGWLRTVSACQEAD